MSKFLSMVVVGLLWLPIAATAQTAAPPPGVIERELMIGEGPYAVSAIVTLPAGKTQVPALLLEHGFGPGTRDADVGPNKIFRDTAWALAQQGVAVLRHGKRTTEHGDLFQARQKHATVEEEWLADAMAGVRLLKAQPEIDPERVFVAGHSASAAMAPHIALESGAAGAVLVSGGAARIQTPGSMIADQANYQASLQPNNPEAQAGARQTVTQAARLDDAGESPDAVVMNHPLWYWRSLNGFDPIADIETLTARGKKVLIVQGGRHYLVGDRQWKGWESLLSKNTSVTRALLPDLNHMMQAGKGKMTPEEYFQSRPVSIEFTQLLARWLLARR